MRIVIFFIFCFGIIQEITSQDFYDLETVQTIEVNFTQSNWDALMDAEKNGAGNYIMAQNVVVNGEVFDSVGVKFKGNSSYRADQNKNPWHIELDTYKDHNYDGYTDIKLANVYKDPSFVRDVLAFQILRQYMDAPLSNYANLYVNGNLIGLYTNTESVSKKFVNSRFGSKNNAFFNCSPPDGAGPQSNDFPNLVYDGQDSTDYYASYGIKSDEGWQELIDLCDTLSNELTALDEILDIDRVLWMLAFDNVTVNLDSYIGRFAQNYYLYRSDWDRFLPIVWDLNECFGVFSQTGTINLNNITSKQRMDHLLHINNTDFPLVRQLLNIPMYKRMYLAHVKTILLENFDNGNYLLNAAAFQETIDASVLADPNKFYSYNNFTSNLNSDVNVGGGPMGGSIPGIVNLMDARSDYLLSLGDFTNIEPEISNISLSNEAPLINETIDITTTVSNGDDVYLGYRTERVEPFTRVQMFDDGAHNDGVANDGVYGAAIEINNSHIQYYIYAENSQAGMFSPRRAEYEYHTITATISDPVVGDLVINEFMASNDETIADQDGEFDDWIELYNNGDEAIELEGYFLSDDGDDLMQWTFPTGSSIEAGGYIVVWADSDEEQTGLHANFKLSAASESVFVVDPLGNIVDEISYADQNSDKSFGRFPNGVGPFQVMNPTFNAENDGTSTNTLDSNIRPFEMKIYPNPANGGFYLETNTYDQKEVVVCDMNGKLALQEMITIGRWVDTSAWNSGMYIVRIGNRFSKVVIGH